MWLSTSNMASLIELTINYNLVYSFWAIVEDSTNFWGRTGWLNKIAMAKMNKISQKIKGKDVFSYKGKRA